MPQDQTLPDLWLLSDGRNDDKLETALAAMPRGNAFVFRHYHLAAGERRKRFDELAEIARSRDHLTVLSGDAEQGIEWGADGIYGPPTNLGKREGLMRFATAHSAREVLLANRNGADALFLSPVFPTRSHPGGACLGVSLFRELAARSQIPVIALGGMTATRAKEMNWPRWAAIDGLS
ncbi:MAG: thiamine phosphate synthase [Erythrobacter sp.]|nr:thiamine phosphate synthase [Erythrobacter sp.]MDJ0978257.1 thiamine phosphate synthase [Erythrobacter sp.]